MGDRSAIDKTIEMVEEAMSYAQEQFEIGQRQEHYNDLEYSQAQQLLETALMELEKLERLAVPEQKEELYRTRIQLQQLQGKMITTLH